MKKEKRKSTSWLMGGLVALTFLSSGSMAAAQTVTSYNDLAWGTGQLEGNTTKITSPNGGSGLPSSGTLVDFATGNPTAVTLTITGGFYNGGAGQATQGANPVSGDASSIFNGKVSGLGVLSYIDSAGSNLVLTFTDMDPNKLYDLTYFAHRNNNGWDRASLVTISGQDSFTNVSSVATDNPDTTNYPGGVLFTGPTSTSTRLPADNDNGYVARFGSIDPGSNGEVVLTISFDGSVGEQFKGKYGSAIRLIEGGNSGGNSSNDLDADGKADIVWRNSSDGSVVIWLMDGATVLSQGSPGGVSTDWTIEDVADMDGDGKADLVWRQTSGTVVVWLMDGATVLSQGSPGSVSTDWTIEDVADMDGDGKADLVWRQTSGTVVVWLMDGATVLSQGSPGSVSTDWTIEDVADMDGDGKADLVWRQTSGTVVVWLMDGATVLSQGSPGSVSTDWTIEDVADMDGDGKADLVWRQTSGTVVVWLMDGATVLSQGSPGSVSTDWTIEDVADMDGDGKADLVWRQTSGTVVVWLMDGATVLSQGSPGSVPMVWIIQPEEDS